MISKQLNLYLSLLHANKYFQAHEALEEIWFPNRFENDFEMKILKGLINAAVSFELIKRGKRTQALKVWENYIKYKKLAYNTKYMLKYDKIFKEIDDMAKNLFYRSLN